MSLPQVAPEISARLANYLLDDPARLVLREIAPLVESVLDEALDQVIAGAARLKAVAEIYQRHAGDIRRIESAQFRALLTANFDAGYLDTCRRTIEQESALGFEGRARVNCGAAVLRCAITVLAHKHRFSSTKLAERTRVLSQAIFFDNATTSTF